VIGALECEGREEAGAAEFGDGVCACRVVAFCSASRGAESETSYSAIAAIPVVFIRIEFRGPSFFFWR